VYFTTTPVQALHQCNASILLQITKVPLVEVDGQYKCVMNFLCPWVMILLKVVLLGRGGIKPHSLPAANKISE